MAGLRVLVVRVGVIWLVVVTVIVLVTVERANAIAFAFRLGLSIVLAEECTLFVALTFVSLWNLPLAIGFPSVDIRGLEHFLELGAILRAWPAPQWKHAVNLNCMVDEYHDIDQVSRVLYRCESLDVSVPLYLLTLESDICHELLVCCSMR